MLLRNGSMHHMIISYDYITNPLQIIFILNYEMYLESVEQPKLCLVCISGVCAYCLFVEITLLMYHNESIK